MMQGITQQPQYTKCHRWSESEARPCNHRPRSCAGTLSGVVGGVEVDKCTTLNDDLRRTILVSAVHTVDQKVVTVSRVAVRLTGKGAAIDDQRTLLNLHSSTAAVIVAAVDGEGCTILDIDSIAAVDAGINAAVLTGVDGVMIFFSRFSVVGWEMTMRAAAVSSLLLVWISSVTATTPPLVRASFSSVTFTTG